MSTPVDKINQPDFKNAAYERMAGPLKVVRDVSGGTAKMRECGETYLPKEPGEKDDEYKIRLARSTFFNAYKKTIGALVGMVFKENPKILDDVKVKDDLENVDLAGSHLDVFAKELFTDAFEGHAFVLVDMQAALPPGSTLADEKATNRRPYWVKYKKDQALNWRSDRINGEEVLTQITFEECSTERSGRFGEEQVTRYRVFELVNGLVQWELHRKITDKDGKDAFILEGSGVTTLPRIPVAVVYGHKTGFLESEPPLLDLAYQNIDHWQQNSDYRTQLHALVPILTVIGIPAEAQKEFKVGPGIITFIADKECDLKYVSHDGEALEATRHALVDIEQRMAQSGLSIMTQRSDSNITATEKKIDQGERTSELSSAARSLKDCLETCVGFHAQYVNLADENGDGGSIELGVAEADLVMDAQALTVANLMVTQKRLRLETLHLLMGKTWRIDLSEEISELKKANLFIGEPPPNDLAKMNKGVDKILAGGVQ